LLGRFHLGRRQQPRETQTPPPAVWLSAGSLKVCSGHPAGTRRSLGARWLPCPKPREASQPWIVPLGVGQSPTGACHNHLSGPSPRGHQVWVYGDWIPHLPPLLQKPVRLQRLLRLAIVLCLIRKKECPRRDKGLSRLQGAPEGLVPGCRGMTHASPHSRRMMERVSLSLQLLLVSPHLQLSSLQEHPYCRQRKGIRTRSHCLNQNAPSLWPPGRQLCPYWSQ
jgi:hypothetical protein